MKKILVISYCYPPTVSPEALVTAKLLHNLSDTQVDVLTLDDGLVSPHFDPLMGAYVRGTKGTIYKVKPGCVVRGILAMKRLPLRPDRWLLLNRKVAQMAERLIRENNYDCLVIRSQYHSAQLVGLHLKKKFPNLPWIACLSDPWSFSDHQANVPLASVWSARQEKKVLQAADAIVLPTDGLRDFMLKTLPELKQKSVTIPHAFDEVLYASGADVPALSSGTLVLRLFGSFYHSRQPNDFIEGIKRVKLPEGKTLKAEIYGGDHPCWRDVQAQTDGRLQWMGTVPHVEALSLMQGSDLLVVVDANSSDNSFYLPSKIVDYIGSGRPILALCGPGTVADLTKAYGGFVVNGSDPDAIARGIEASLAREQIKIEDSVRQRFDAKTVAADFCALLDKVTAKQNLA